MVRLNITMPEDVAEQMKTIKNKSRFISEAVQEKLERQNREKIKQEMIEGYKESAKEDYEFSKEWEAVDLEGWD